MATVKGVIDEFCDRVLINRESTIVGGTTPAARQFLSLFKFIGTELIKPSQSWPQLKRTYVFTTQTGVASYQLPGDFHRLLTGTQWGVTSQIPLSGPLSDAQIAYRTYGVGVEGAYAGYQINGAVGYTFNTAPYVQKSQGYFQLSPAGPDNVTQNVIAYGSRNYVWPKAWVANTIYTLGTKVSGVNNIYICTTAGTSGTTRPSVLTGTVVDGTVTWTVYNEPYDPVDDDDFCLLDDDLFVEGLRWAWFRANKQDYQQEMEDWKQSVRASLGRQNGEAIINAGYDVDTMFMWPVVPDGSWSV